MNIRMIRQLLLSLTFLMVGGCDISGSLGKESPVSKDRAESHVIASPLEGILMRDGEPLPNTKIIRTLRWNDNETGLVQEFFSDSRGHFLLPEHRENLDINPLAQFVAKSTLDVELDGRVYELWYNNKFEPGLYAEIGAPLQGLVCDVTEEEVALRIGLSKIMTRCRWQSMPEDVITTGR